MDNTFTMISTGQTLNEYCLKIKDVSCLVMDTEFFRVNTYYPELCLIQVATEMGQAIIDPYGIQDLTPFYTICFDHAVTKVFHSARQDLELFYNLTGQVPGPVFDTQIAASYLGYDSQIGYASLVQDVLGIELGKSLARTNWKRRPLSERQLRYAINDVIYLSELYRIMKDNLQKKGLLEQVDTDCLALEEHGLYNPDPLGVWKKIRISRKLESQAQDRLIKLAAWREVTARKRNKPRKWILQDAILIDISRSNPVSRKELKNIKNLDKAKFERFGTELLQTLGNI